MSKKHFIAIAEALRSSNASLYTCNVVAIACLRANPNFDRARFLAACGY